MGDKVLTWKDLANLAIIMEENGRKFYLDMAGKAADEEVRRIFTQFAEEEEEHAGFFRRGLLSGEKYPEFPREQARYLLSLGRGPVFEADEAALGDPKRALGVVIEAEKESILYYTELSHLFEDEDGRRALAGILSQEKKHLIEVRERYEGN